jgi:O-antigen/teichoic acid export membrane protein
LKASLVARVIAVSLISLLVLALAPFTKKLLASDSMSTIYWSVVLSFGLLLWAYFPLALQAYKRFAASVAVDVSLGISRVLIVGGLLFLGALTLDNAFAAYAIGTLVAVIAGLVLLKTSFLKADIPREVYSRLLKFSSWVGVNRIVSAVSGRLDVQMLAAMSGSTITGQYSIAQRLALFVTVLVSSLSAVMAPRLSAFEDKDKERAYILKATLATLPIIAGLIVWIIIAKPFILILFGEKYLPAVAIFQVYAASMIPFILAAPPVTAIIYAIKRPVYVGYFSFFQLAAIFLINILLIPKIGAYGPLVAFLIVHTILAAFSWGIVRRYYWGNK